MNIDDIKRNLNNGKSKNLERPAQLPVQAPAFKEPKPTTVQKPFVETEKSHLANKVFDPEEEEEPIVPNSRTWTAPDDLQPIDPLGSVSRLIHKLELDDVEVDWREKSKKGRRSRMNFTNFMVDTI